MWVEKERLKVPGRQPGATYEAAGPGPEAAWRTKGARAFLPEGSQEERATCSLEQFCLGRGVGSSSEASIFSVIPAHSSCNPGGPQQGCLTWLLPSLPTPLPWGVRMDEAFGRRLCWALALSSLQFPARSTGKGWSENTDSCRLEPRQEAGGGFRGGS